MRVEAQLPENYQKSFQIDLQKDKKLALLVNILALVIFLAVFALGVVVAPMEAFLTNSGWIILLYLVGTVVYLVLHELVHGLFIRIFGRVRPHYGFTGVYAYAGSDDYFDRNRYIIISMAPVVVWGIVLAVLSAVTWGTSLFWVMYLLQAGNLSGSAGDFYVTFRCLKLPKDILVQDSGVNMTIYTPNAAAQQG